MLLSAVGVVGNLAIGLHFMAVLIPLINFLIDGACIAYSIMTKRWREAAVVAFFFACFVLFPFLWFTTGGTMSSSLPLVIGLGVVVAIIFKGKWRMGLFFATLLVFSVFILIELYFPNNFIPYPSREAWYLDILFGFIMSYLTSGGLAYFTLVRYNAAKREAEELVQQLERLSTTDALTGVFNRRHLMVRLDEEMRNAYDSGSPLTLCILDIDHFKRINDTYGHLYGDEVLTILATTISGCLGEGELFGRYGGEEFLLVFPHCDLPAALETLQRVYAALAAVAWSEGNTVTVSAGVSVYSKGLSYSRFLEQADKKLYQAKENGRNRIEH